MISKSFPQQKSPFDKDFLIFHRTFEIVFNPEIIKLIFSNKKQ